MPTRPPLTLLLLLLAALALPACGRDADDTTADDALSPAELAQRVDRLEQRFHQAVDDRTPLDDAIDELAELLHDHPEHAPGHTLLGRMLQFHDRNAQALDHFETALELEPGDVELHLLAGTVAFGLGELDRAHRHYSEAVGLEPEHGVARLHLAQVQIERQEYDRARRTLLDTLALDDSLHGAYFALGTLYARQGRLPQAIDQVERALERLDDDQRDPRYERRLVSYTRTHATLLRRANQPQAALDVLRELPAEHQMTLAVADDLALCWQMLGRPAHAARHYESLAMFSPDDERVPARAARWYIKAGDAVEARRQIEAVQRINPNAAVLDELRTELQALEADPARGTG